MNIRRLGIVAALAVLTALLATLLVHPRPPAPIPAFAPVQRATPAAAPAPVPLPVSVPVPVPRPAAPAEVPAAAPPSAEKAPRLAQGRKSGRKRRPSGGIMGRVVCDGKPVPGAWVSAKRPSDESSLSNDPFGTNDGTAADDAGRFSVEAAPGVSRVVVMLTGYAPAASAPLEVAENVTVDAGDIALCRLGQGTLEAKVLRADGTPYSGELQIQAESHDESAPAAGFERFTADADGNAKPVRALTVGSYELRAIVKGFESEPVPVVVRDGEDVAATLVLKQAVGLRVKVVDDETGAPI